MARDTSWTPAPMLGDPSGDASDLAKALKSDVKIKKKRKPSFDMPAEAAYGFLGRTAEALGMPLGWAYPACLAVYAGLYSDRIIHETPGGESLRATLYVILLGKPGAGKSRVINRALAVLNPDKICVQESIPGSERGLAVIFGQEARQERREGLSQLLAVDELKELFGKAAIQNSGLPTALCTLFYNDRHGGATAKGHTGVHSRITILGALKIHDICDFKEAFNSATGDGLYDRCILAPPPGKPFRIQQDWQPLVEARYPTRVAVTGAIGERAADWQWEQHQIDPESVGRRGRLSEILLRVAAISASANGEKEISDECFEAAKAFVEWQERVRNGGYSPSLSKNEQARLSEVIRDTMLSKSNGKQKWIIFKQLAHSKHWSEYYGYGLVRITRDAMVAMGDLEQEQADEDDPFSKTGRYRLASYFL